MHAGRTKTWTEFKVPDEAIGCGFHEAVRGVLSHHVVIRDGKIANYHPYPPTPWNANPRDIYGTPGPYEDAVQNTPIFEENGPDKFKGIDIMRAVRSFDPCLPCGVHMYLGNGKVLETRHSPCSERRGTSKRQRLESKQQPDAAERRVPRPNGTHREIGRQARAGGRSGVARRRARVSAVHHGIAWGGPRSRLGVISQTAEGEQVTRRLLEDDLVASVLLLHGLHPDDIETRVLRALDKVRPSLQSNGGDVNWSASRRAW